MSIEKDNNIFPSEKILERAGIDSNTLYSYGDKASIEEARKKIRLLDSMIENIVLKIFNDSVKYLKDKNFSFILRGNLHEDRNLKYIINHNYKIIMLDNVDHEEFYKLLEEGVSSLLSTITENVDPSSHGILFFLNDVKNFTSVTKSQFFDEVAGFSFYVSGDVTPSAKPFMCINIYSVVIPKKNKS